MLAPETIDWKQIQKDELDKELTVLRGLLLVEVDIVADAIVDELRSAGEKG